MTLSQILTPQIQKAVQTVFDITVDKVEFQATRKDFEGDITMVIFPLLKIIKGNPAEIGTKIGDFLIENVAEVEKFNVVAGFLNIVISDNYYLNFFNEIKDNPNFGFVLASPNDKAVMVEYSSPNTNKPLHLGHVRNNLLGYSVAEIIKASGKKVYKTQIINDRGIHICKSMLAWKKFGNGETPESTGLKGDKLIGKYYVLYNDVQKEELKLIFSLANREYINTRNNRNLHGHTLGNLDKNLKIELIANSYNKAIHKYLIYKKIINQDSTPRIANSNSFYKLTSYELTNYGNRNLIDVTKRVISETPNVLNYIRNKKIEFPDGDSRRIFKILKNELDNITPIHLEAQQMLLDWEAGKLEVMKLWKMMNDWVYAGFAQTYENLGVDFDKYYYESNTYLLGKDVVANELAKGKEKSVFYKKDDNSVWIDLREEGLDEKIVQRSDGTSVYMTQDIGTAIQRVKDFPDVGGMVYTVGNEQDYHFKVLFLILKKLGFDWAESLFHLSYGMVELPSGKMKSREGTVVDADDLMEEMTATAGKIATDLGKLEGYSVDEKAKLFNMIGLGALKYYILKVDPKKQILFNPEESVDFAGNTGPFIQYTYARIQSILRKADFDIVTPSKVEELHPKEKELLKQIELFPEVIQNAANNHSPALVANYTYELVKEYNSFYQSVSILGEENLDKKVFRVQLSKKVSDVIKSAFKLLGIEVPERM